MKKILCFTFVLLITICMFSSKTCFASQQYTSGVLNYDSKVWELKEYGHYGGYTDYGGIRIYYNIYRLNDNYNYYDDYNFYVIDQTSYQSLDSNHNKVVKKVFSGIKYMWLNVGTTFVCDVNEYNNTQMLYDYSTKEEINEYSYTLHVGENIGVNISDKTGVSGTASASFSRTITYSTSDRKLSNTSETINDLYKCEYVYDCFKIKECSIWDYLKSGLILGNVGVAWTAYVNGQVKHKDNYKTFLNEMVEYSTFIVKTPKHNQKMKLYLSCYSQQLYIDYDWSNSHTFDTTEFGQVIIVSND